MAASNETEPDSGAREAPLALVAGGSRGLGLLIAHELAERGYRLLLCARDPDELERARNELAIGGYPVSVQPCDVSDADAVETLVERAEAEQGPIEVAICVAGIIQVGPLAALTRQHFRDAVDIMLWGPVNVALSVSERMRHRRRGKIGIITSIGGLVSVPHLLPYSTAKFGAVGFSRGLRTELAQSGVSVTTIAPGLMRTGSHVRAKFVGDQAKEYAWFSAGASLPLISMDAARAARRIVAGVLAGRTMVVLTPLAKIGMRVDGLAPTLTTGLLTVMARLLPKAPGGPAGTIEGWQAARRLSPTASRLVGRITELGSRAARRNNELRAG
jgi:NAD(P)-dependent dehydrogenase (short-subunit alcohol dehydrogenase family)